MRLQDIAALAGDIAHIKLRQNSAGLWEVGVFLGGAISQEHKVTKFHNRAEPRTWKSLDKLVRTLEESVFQCRFVEIDIPFQTRIHHDQTDEGGA
ncbi:hypothetical protein FEP08_05628 [Burkholderia multivorans]|nr:hypothetical protein [Burkholderia multivorans]